MNQERIIDTNKATTRQGGGSDPSFVQASRASPQVTIISIKAHGPHQLVHAGAARGPADIFTGEATPARLFEPLKQGSGSGRALRSAGLGRQVSHTAGAEPIALQPTAASVRRDNYERVHESVPAYCAVVNFVLYCNNVLSRTWYEYLSSTCVLLARRAVIRARRRALPPVHYVMLCHCSLRARYPLYP